MLDSKKYKNVIDAVEILVGRFEYHDDENDQNEENEGN